jgi:predicted ATPase
MNRYVITGGPCVGKTTVVGILEKRGYLIVPEQATVVINRELKKDSDALPWKNSVKFERELAKQQFITERNEQRQGNIFFDRGLVDIYGYTMTENNPVPILVRIFGKNRYKKIFLLDTLPDYENSKVRREDKEFALAVHEEIRKAYLLFGYTVITVPVLSPDERADFITNHL